ncbi:hypothetical protein HY573_02500 [Candidatus Parcubacteria bacterium]|nr:hypothetical protein [Candidatus Parcubacteria bacterium]
MIGIGCYRVPDRHREPVRVEVTLAVARRDGYKLAGGQALPRTVRELEARKKAEMENLAAAGAVRMTPAGWGRLALWRSGRKELRLIWSGDTPRRVEVVS